MGGAGISVALMRAVVLSQFDLRSIHLVTPRSMASILEEETAVFALRIPTNRSIAGAHFNLPRQWQSNNAKRSRVLRSIAR